MSDKCNHKWVEYQPFRGEKYWCCANAGCGIKFLDFLGAPATKPTPKMTDDEYGWLYGHFHVEPSVDKPKEPVCPVIPHKKGWVPVEMDYYMMPKGSVPAVVPKEELPEPVTGSSPYFEHNGYKYELVTPTEVWGLDKAKENGTTSLPKGLTDWLPKADDKPPGDRL